LFVNHWAKIKTMKHLLILIFLSLQTLVFAQKPFKIAFKINPYTMLTGRYGLNAEIPLSKAFSATLEGRYLTKDWDVGGGEIFRTLKKSKGVNAIAGLRYYFPIERKFRWYLSSEYRFRQASFETTGNKKKFNEVNLITGIQLLPAKNNFTLDFGMGTGITTEARDGIDVIRSYGVIRIDILVGYKF
jgi:hypothetical protein